jgi:O-antigen/teichoic acid export membrane protein
MAVGRGGAALLEFAAIAVLAGAIGPGGLGIYTFAVGIVTLFRLIPNLGLLPVVTRDIAQDPARERVLVPNVIYLRAVLGAAAYALLAGTVVIAGYSGDARDAALIAGTILLLLPLDTLQIVLQVRLRMASISVAVIAQSLVNLAAVVVLVGAGVTATSTYLLVYVGAHVLGTVVVTVIALRTAPLSWRPDLSTWRPVLAAAIPLGLAVLLVTLYTRLDLAVLAALKPADEAGQYGVAYRFLDAFLLLSPVMMSVLTPVLARSQADP